MHIVEHDAAPSDAADDDRAEFARRRCEVRNAVEVAPTPRPIVRRIRGSSQFGYSFTGGGVTHFLYSMRTRVVNATQLPWCPFRTLPRAHRRRKFCARNMSAGDCIVRNACVIEDNVRRRSPPSHYSVYKGGNLPAETVPSTNHLRPKDRRENEGPGGGQ